MVNVVQKNVLDARWAVTRIFDSLPGCKVLARRSEGRKGQVELVAALGGAKIHFLIEAKSRITPQTALDVSEKIKIASPDRLLVIYAPVISPRVAQLLREQGVGYADAAGNCWLYWPKRGVLIERIGFHNSAPKPAPPADLFSPKSSRIVRAMLSEPIRSWRVRELADHPDVQVSPGLVVKVKRALIEEGYAIEHQKRLYLRDPYGLLENWSQKYPGPPQRLVFYAFGDARAAEEALFRWSRQHQLTCAVAGLSAAWRLAPETRYHVASIYVEDRGFDEKLLKSLASDFGVKPVESGANLGLWRAYDPSVFTGQSPGNNAPPITSPLQTYLDVKQDAGRGEEAAAAIFDKHLRRGFDRAAEQARELQSAD